jgi:hypothetical protein
MNGLVYAPYITVQQVEAICDTNSKPKMGLSSKYSIASIGNYYQPIKTKKQIRIEKIEKFLYGKEI